tara:strand:- start:179 stop:406 length:228 start_codon:yes stop_codon:yes gene_type:complete
MAVDHKRIVYNEDDGIASIICPSPNWKGTIEELAAKDVPTGKKYKIIDLADVSTDRSFRDAWVADEADLTDGEGA